MPKTPALRMPGLGTKVLVVEKNVPNITTQRLKVKRQDQKTFSQTTVLG
jgi:hypothetical protein